MFPLYPWRCGRLFGCHLFAMVIGRVGGPPAIGATVRTTEESLVSILRISLAVLLIGGLAVPAFSEGAKITDHTVKSIDGEDVDLKDYEGKVLLVVNVASKCGLTPQYNDLVELHEKYKDQGFEVLGFPANNFMGQEPGTNEEIKTFCSSKYGVEFPMFSKVSVKDEDVSPLYQELTSEEENGEFGGPIQWNFTKFLVNKEGKVVNRFEPKTKPSDEEVVAAIEAELGK
jgi:glutathione peroxidase